MTFYCQLPFAKPMICNSFFLSYVNYQMQVARYFIFLINFNERSRVFLHYISSKNCYFAKQSCNLFQVSANVTTGPQDGSPSAPRDVSLTRTVSSVTLHWRNSRQGSLPLLGYYIEARNTGVLLEPLCYLLVLCLYQQHRCVIGAPLLPFSLIVLATQLCYWSPSVTFQFMAILATQVC